MELKLNEQQSQAVISESPLVVLVAGAGSGKTATLVQRLIHDLDRGIPAATMGVFTFTVAAAAEFTERIEKHKPGTRLGFCGTLHAWCLEVGIRSQCVEKIIDDSDYWKIVDDCGDRLKIRPSMMAKIKADIRFGKDPGTKGNLLLKSVERQMATDKVIHLEGLVPMANKIIKNHPEFCNLESIYVDEYQDTSKDDHALYQMMNAKKQFYVGDPDQAIMGFRGGDHTLLEGLAEDADPMGGLLMLETNYRCGVSICALADRIITRIKDRIQKKTTPAEGNRTGAISIKEHPDVPTEIQDIMHRIKKQVEAGFPFGEIAVLAKFNADANRIAQALRDASGYPVQLAGERDKNALRITEQAVGSLIRGEKRSEYRAAMNRQYGNVLDLEIALRLLGVTENDARIICRAATDKRDRWEPSPANCTALLESFNEWKQGVTDTNAITVSTVHKSKGKEWDSVFIAGFHSYAWRDSDETRRLAYVAVTRARRALHMSYARSIILANNPVPRDTQKSMILTLAGA